MTPSRSTLSAFALLLGLPLAASVTAGAAQAASPRTSFRAGITLRVVQNGPGTASMNAKIKSSAIDETIALQPVDTALHGVAELPAAPAVGSTVELTLTDSFGRQRGRYGGVVERDGVLWTSSLGGGAGSDDCTTRTGCTATSLAADIDLVGSDLFPSLSGVTLAIDLAGADTFDIASAELVVTEGSGCTARACGDSADASSGATPAGAGASSTGTPTASAGAVITAGLAWDPLELVWEGALTVAPVGLVDVKVKSFDALGELIDTTKSKLAAPWDDAGAGVTTLGVDEDPLTSVALLWNRGHIVHTVGDSFSSGRVLHTVGDSFSSGHTMRGMLIVSQGWYPGAAVPVKAEIELTNGGTVLIPANSYQRTAPTRWRAGIGTALFNMRLGGSATITVRGLGGTITQMADAVQYASSSSSSGSSSSSSSGSSSSLGSSSSASSMASSATSSSSASSSLSSSAAAPASDTSTIPTELLLSTEALRSPICDAGFCVTLVEGPAGPELVTSWFSSNPAEVPPIAFLDVAVYDRTGALVAADTADLPYDNEVSVVFANELGFSEDPTGLPVGGRVRLLDAVDTKGKSKVLAKGRFHGSISRDEDGELGFVGADKDKVGSRGDVFVIGASVGLDAASTRPGRPPATGTGEGNWLVFTR